MTAPSDYHRRYFRPVDVHFAAAMERLAGSESNELHTASMLVSFRAGRGDTCLDMVDAGGRNISEYVEADEPGEALPDGRKWIKALKNSPAVGGPGDYRPLVLDGRGRLYLHRYWRYEKTIADGLLGMSDNTDDIDAKPFARSLARLFPGGIGTDWQRVAAMAAARGKLCVISGGPGTGKTSAVVRILALLIERGIGRGKAPSAVMAAPTGKASKRLQESVRMALDGLPVDEEVKRLLPAEVFTLHRLIGLFPGSSLPVHGPENPLPHDIVVVDECSMADAPLMAKLVMSLRSDARLILLGDRDQLASVEAGAVLGDLCDTGRSHGYSPAFVKAAAALAGQKLPADMADPAERPLADSLVILKKSYRFGPDSGIGALAAAVREGDAARALDVLGSDEFPDVTLTRVARKEELKEKLALLVPGLYGGLSSSAPESAFASLAERILLCALRRGPFGSETVNLLAERILRESGHIRGLTPWYPGRPVMVTGNDYGQKLFNGDTGVVLADEVSGEARVFFQAETGAYRKVIPARLPVHESAYAVTVHKSQGSEFGSVVVILPDRYSPVLTRELFYTAITRAKQSVEIWGSGDVLEKTVNARIERVSGLRDALWG